MKTLALLCLVVATGSVGAQTFDPANFKELQWTNVGPNRGGRSIACSGVRTRPKEYYFGAAGGGLWKTEDEGETWKCVTDGALGSSSVGAVAVSESNPDVVYIGMGERDIRGDLAEGDGVYRSSDAGKTWTHVGLDKARTISRIVIDPKNPDLVYVAALGHVYGPNPERGVFKSTDGGKTWDRVLYESERAGAVDLVIDPADSSTLYAATWEAWRTPYYMNSGGPGSKLWKSTDAGAHWTDLTRNPGLPKGVVGKIGLAVAPSNHARVYAIVEAHDGGIFRSDDAGSTWTKVNDENEWRQRAWYFSHLCVDPKNADRVYCMNVGFGRSSDGGKTWTNVRSTHSDNHDMWINPDDPQKMIEANDGGASVSLDGGGRWTAEDYPTAQIYHVVADTHVPYRIYGAQQDNSSLMLTPSQEDTPTKRNFQGTAGGESGYIAVKPDNPEIVIGGNYSGDVDYIDYSTNFRKRIDPWPLNPMGHGAEDLVHRIQWTYPILFSNHDPNTIYTASQYLLKSTDFGHSWRQISPDLTRNDRSKQKSSGGPITQDNTSIEYYDTIFTVAESPLANGLIWVGSDDGLVHITRNGGKTWTNITPKGLPTWARISMIEASPHDAATAYLAANNYQNDDLGVYLYRTHDYGKTWTKISAGIPDGAFARVCREDIYRKSMLYAATEKGVWVSFDDGDHWTSLQQNLPVTPVHDVICKDDDLILATHGRSFWIMKDATKLRELTGSPIAAPTLYPPLPQVRTGFRTTVRVDYFLPKAATDVKLDFFDWNGRAVGTTKGSTEAGWRRATGSLSVPGFGTFPGMVLWSGFSRPISAPPGDYTVRLTVDGVTITKPLRLDKDPRTPATVKDLQDQYAFAQEIVSRVDAANTAVLRIRDMKTQIDSALADPRAAADLKAQGEALKTKLTSIEGEIYQYRSKSGEDPLNFPVKLNDQLAGVLSFVQSGEMAPPQQARDVFAILDKALRVQLNALAEVERTDLNDFNAGARRLGIKAVTPKNPELSRGGFGRRGGEEEERERENGGEAG